LGISSERKGKLVARVRHIVQYGGDVKKEGSEKRGELGGKNGPQSNPSNLRTPCLLQGTFFHRKFKKVPISNMGRSREKKGE